MAKGTKRQGSRGRVTRVGIVHEIPCGGCGKIVVLTFRHGTRAPELRVIDVRCPDCQVVA